MGQMLFTTDHLAVGYQGKVLIDNIEIELEKGKIMTLIGPNGSGKSTILKSVSKQLSVIGGAVYLDGKDLSDIREKELSEQIALVLTEHVKTELMTCEDVVSSGRYPYTGKFGILTREDHSKVREAMELVHILELADRDFRMISDGQKQRVMLARAICQEPRVLILDEPTSYLDIKYKLEFFQILQEMTRKGELSVLMSLHELDLAQRVSDRILCVNGSKVVRTGTPEEIFTKGFIQELYQMEKGSFDHQSGRMELSKITGTPEVFLLAGNGTGTPWYRKLQRKGIPFSTGILAANDVDYQVAKDLAQQVIGVEAFEMLTEESLSQARVQIDETKETICTLTQFGTWNQEFQGLVEYAQKKGKLTWQK